MCKAGILQAYDYGKQNMDHYNQVYSYTMQNLLKNVSRGALSIYCNRRSPEYLVAAMTTFLVIVIKMLFGLTLSSSVMVRLCVNPITLQYLQYQALC